MSMQLTKLGTEANMGAFGELFNLVLTSGTQLSATLMPKIKGLSEKAQNQIYGRFYQASHFLEKNPAKGRELLAKNGDFIGLAGKFLEVKTDIERSAKIYKLFQENAPIKTIHSSYKKLSSASRKEIEEHLGMTAAKAAPEALRAAFVHFFDGMGVTSSSSAPSSEIATSNPTEQKVIKIMALEVVKMIKEDLDFANGHVNLITGEISTTEEAVELYKLYYQFSFPAKALIAKRLERPSGANKAGEELLRAEIEAFFRGIIDGATNYELLSKDWTLSKEEAIDIPIYCKLAQSFDTVLPRFDDKKPVIAEKEFDKIAEMHYRTLSKPHLEVFTKLAQTLTAVRKSQTLEKAAKTFTLDVLKDYRLLEQNVGFFETKDGAFEVEQTVILQIFDCLSPYAQLMLEQKYIRDYYSKFSQRTRPDTMRALLSEANPTFSKRCMLELLDHFNSGVDANTILGGRDETHVGKIERLQMEAYLSFPRYLACDFIQNNAAGSVEALEQYVSENMNVNTHGLKEFEGLQLELAKQKTQYLRQFVAEHPDAMENDNLNHFSDVLKQFLIKNDLCIKKDFIDMTFNPGRVIIDIFNEVTDGILQQE